MRPEGEQRTADDWGLTDRCPDPRLATSVVRRDAGDELLQIAD